MHHYIEDIGQSVKSIRDTVLKATEYNPQNEMFKIYKTKRY